MFHNSAASLVQYWLEVLLSNLSAPGETIPSKAARVLPVFVFDLQLVINILSSFIFIP